MTASLRGLAILAAIAALLGVLVVRAASRPPPEAVDRALVPGLDVATITALTWDRSPQPPVTVTLGEPPVWEEGTTKARADADRVRDVLAAVRAGRWHRRAGAAAAGQVTVQLSLAAGQTSHVVGVGQELAGTEQQWLVVGDRALLVDRWVARALSPEPLALRSRHPFATAGEARQLGDASALSLARDPGHLTIGAQPGDLKGTGAIVVRAELADALVRALEAVEIVRLSHAPAGAAALRFTGGVDGALWPRCPDDPSLAFVSSAAGDGCISRAAFDAVRGASDALAGPALATAEPRILPAPISSIAFPDGSALDLTSVPRIAGAPADRARVAELIAVLAAPRQLVPLPPRPDVRARLRIASGPFDLSLALLDGDLVRRGGEPVALQLSHEAWQVLARPPSAYAERSLWAEEPTTIAALRIDGITYTRGAVLGEWTRTPRGPVDGARIEALAAALASLDRDDTVSLAGFTPAHRVTLTLAALTGATGAHTLEVAAATGSSCAARTPAGAARLPAAVCASLAAAAR